MCPRERGFDLDKTAIQIRDVDHVATAVVELCPGENVHVSGIRSGHVIVARERIPVGHKIALRDIGADEEIRKIRRADRHRHG